MMWCDVEQSEEDQSLAKKLHLTTVPTTLNVSCSGTAACQLNVALT